MSLTLGNGPFARNDAAGETNAHIEAPGHILWFHDVPKRVRATLGGETIVDTERARLLHETRLLPVYYVPRDDVRFDLLEPTEHSSHCPFKGDARYWTIRAGDQVAENAVWGYDAPIAGAPDLAPYVALYFGKVDHWYEEDEEIFGHPRDPFHRIDVRTAERRVRVLVDGAVVADSSVPKLLFETGLPVRYYLPLEHWDQAALTPSGHSSTCAYKGAAAYNGVRTAAGEVADLVWRYEAPLSDGRDVAGLLCAPQEHERVEVELSTPGR
ncbi:MAG: DUF427 domain-containing protein [Acidimicrobiia bacterium]|nr:DUF427 domain-containing protein [Acidimicrobiia bacterium]